MKILWVLPILLFIAGCLLSTPNQQVAASDVITPEVESVPAKSFLYTVPERPSFSVMAVAEPIDSPNCPSPLTEEFDAETLEDNLILSGSDQHPPENEGLTLPADEMIFDFPVVENEKVLYYINYYTGPARTTFTRWLQRSERYVPFMRKIFEDQGLPQDLTYLAMVESGFNDKAYSWAHAVGPWQFIEETGNDYGLSNNWWRDERRDFKKSTQAAARFLSDLYKRFDGDWYLAVAAYNAGGGKISRAVKKYKTTNFWELSRGKYLQTETKNYLPKLLAVLTIAKNPEEYGFVDIDCLEPLEYDLVIIPDVTDLDLVAKLCEVSYEEIKALNPELKRWCTPPGIDEYQLRIPTGKKDFFEKRYAKILAEDRAKYKRHRIARGDTLGAIAKKYRIRVDDIIDLNNIRNPRALRVGSDLILPLHEKYSRLPVETMQDDYIRSRRKSYKVRSGDSLWSISRRFAVSEKELRVWNKLGWSNVIRPGQTLVVSQRFARSASRVKNAIAATTVPKASRKIIYKVKSGDTLWDIGRKHSVSAVQVRSWNNLTKNHVLHPGDTLTLQVHDEYRG
jgi:peptidoglycan lytic transglycosylase D